MTLSITSSHSCDEKRQENPMSTPNSDSTPRSRAVRLRLRQEQEGSREVSLDLMAKRRGNSATREGLR